MQVTLDISDKFASVINGLSEAIRAACGSAAGAQNAAGKVESKATDKVGKADKAATSTKVEKGPIFWADNSTGYFGKVDSEAEYEAKKVENDGVYKITESIYKEKTAELKAKNAAEAKAKKEAAAASSSKKESAEGKAEKSTATHPTIEQLVEVFASYLPKDLDAAERAQRAKFVKPLLERFGASRAKEILPEHRALAMNLVERKMAGEDIDPTSADFAEVCAQAEDDLV